MQDVAADRDREALDPTLVATDGERVEQRLGRMFVRAVARVDDRAADLLGQQFDVHSNQITTWKAQLLDGAAGVFGSEPRSEPATPAVDVKTLHAKIGELTLTNDPRSSRGQAFCPARSAKPAC